MAASKDAPKKTQAKSAAKKTVAKKTTATAKKTATTKSAAKKTTTAKKAATTKKAATAKKTTAPKTRKSPVAKPVSTFDKELFKRSVLYNVMTDGRRLRKSMKLKILRQFTIFQWNS